MTSTIPMRVIAANAAPFAAFVLLGDFVLTQWMPPPAGSDKEFRFPVRTNSLGFRDAAVRQVAEQSDRGRRLFIPGEVHHSRESSELIARRLSQAYSPR